jgi:uracil-DNA glycosylase family 4
MADRFNISEVEYQVPGEFAQFLQAEYKNCSRCDLSRGRLGRPVFARGADRPSILFVGEAPGEYEEQEGKPFVGPSGKLITQVFNILGMTADVPTFRFTNIVMCRPRDYSNPDRNRQPTANEIKACWPRLEQEIYCCDPMIIVALGAEASKTLGGSDCAPDKIRGEFVEIEIDSRIKARAKIKYPLFVTHHPAYILRNLDFRMDSLPIIKKLDQVFDNDDEYSQFMRDIIRVDVARQIILAHRTRADQMPKDVEDIISLI